MTGADGEPTGELKEAAQNLMRAEMPSESLDDVYQSFLQHMDEAAADGLTSAQNASRDPRDQPVFERALAASAFKLRIRFAPLILPKDGGSPRGHFLKTPLTDADLAEYRHLRDTFRERRLVSEESHQRRGCAAALHP